MWRIRHCFLWVLVLMGLTASLAGAQLSRPSASGTDVWAGNVIVPQSRAFVPSMPSAQPSAGVAITEIRVGVVILEQMATTTMDISLANPGPVRQEAELLVPVPERAVVRGFDFQGAGAEPSARLLPKEEARRTYETIVARVRDPALLEFMGYNLVRSSVFPVDAGGTQKVRLTYEHLLPADGARVDYVLPRSESLDYAVPWTISVKIKSARRIATVYSPSHVLQTVRTNDQQLSARVSETGVITPGPFRLSYLLDDGGLAASLLAYPDPRVGGGYFLLLAGLPAHPDPSSAQSIRREVTLVIDRSGSMNGEKLEQARAAAFLVLEGLEPGEVFNLIVYNEAVDVFAPRPVLKNRETLLAARQWLMGVQPRGGTNIHDALLEALRPQPSPETLPIVLFLTDGLPTIGQTSEVAIREMVLKGNIAHRRVFTFGVGVDVNTPLLEKIASETRAFATFVLPGEDVEVKVGKVFRGLSGPVLADLDLQVATTRTKAVSPGGRVHDLIPSRLPDLFEGDQLVVLGQYVGDSPLTFSVSGNFLGTRRAFRLTFDLNSASTRNAFVPRLWASRKIAVLVDAIRAAGADTDLSSVRGATPPPARFQELVDEVVRLSTEFGILTEYTAFLAREGTDLGQRDMVLQEAQRNFMDRAVKVRSGLSSVNQEVNRQAQASQKVLNPTNKYWDANMNPVAVTDVRQMADMAFYRRGERWIDSRILENEEQIQPGKVIRFGTEDFNALAERLVQDGRQGSISLTGEVLMMVDGQAVLVIGPTPSR